MDLLKYFALVVAFGVSLLASAQDRKAFGMYGQYALNMHAADFQQLPGVPNCCPRFERGIGPGFALGVLYDIPFNDLFRLQLRAGYRSLGGELSTIEPTTILENGSATPGEFTHTLAASLSNVGIEPMIRIRAFENFSINVGLSAGVVFAQTYDQREQITQPENSGTFLDSLGNDTHMRVRNQSSGDIPNASPFHVALLGGVSYSLPLNNKRTLFLAPEATYTFGITPLASGLSWNVHAIRLGVSVLYSPADEIDSSPLVPVIVDKVITIPEPTPKPSPAPKPPILVSVSIVGIESDNHEVPLVRLRLEEFESTLMMSFLNYIFFEENNASLPVRYHTLTVAETDTFNVDHLSSTEKMRNYYQVLNIIGRRLVDNPNATVRLTGCNQDIRDEKDNLMLSRNRALVVKKYLSEVWQISDARIKIEERNLPVKAANTTMQDGAEENRRVEITSDNAKILAPIIKHDTVRSASIQTIRIKPVVTPDAPVARWRLTIKQAGRSLHVLDGKGLPPVSIDSDISNSLPILLKSGGDITCSLALFDSAASEYATEAPLPNVVAGASIPIDRYTIKRKQTERLGNKGIDRFSLLLFDVRSAEVSAPDIAIIDLIKARIHPESIVRVIGYSDRLGDTKYNQQLAESRARSVASRLGATVVTTEGIGQANLFESSLPEGRLYTRTVDVVVETPVR
ncbi:MAG: OmpA family protein [bacterium]|nr:OmpA family protein [bacterium]